MKQAAIGADVKTKDGKSIGQVEHLVFDSERQKLDALIADKGILDAGRVVDIEYVESMSEELVQLRLTQSEVENLPKFVKQEYVRFDDATIGGAYTGMGVPLQSTGWTHVGTGSGGLPNTGSGSLYAPTIIGDYSTEVVSPVDESDVMIGNDTDVISSDGHKIGVVDDVLMDDGGVVTGIIVQKGFIFHHDLQIPKEWIAGVAHDHVRLSVTKDEAEKAKKD